MPVKNTPEEREIIKLIPKLPVQESDKNQWMQQIDEFGLTEELVEEIREKLNQPVAGQEDQAGRYRMQLARLVQRWRLASQSRHFSSH
ncbi:MAG: hypothetical protein GYA48_11895 [Chloroflexi bacterium]|nr:hypothetical protein [Chloroflexota bacterium]